MAFGDLGQARVSDFDYCDILDLAGEGSGAAAAAAAMIGQLREKLDARLAGGKRSAKESQLRHLAV